MKLGSSSSHLFKSVSATKHFETRQTGLGVSITNRSFTASKIETSLVQNCDYFGVSDNGLVVGLSDGVSRSFNSYSWAKKIVRFSLRRSEIPISKINWSYFAQSTLRRLKGQDESHVKIARSRGSQATLMRLEISLFDSQTIQLRIESIGDCLFCLIPQESSAQEDILLWPFEGVESFPDLPSVISSVDPAIRGDFEESQTFFCDPTSKVLLMTDALARYVCTKLAAGVSIKEAFPFLGGHMNFSDWTHALRLGEEIENDDLTIIEVTFQ